MICRPIKKSDYATACEWWAERKFSIVPEVALPSTGAIVEGYCMGWIHLAEEGFAFTGFVIGNPAKKGVEVFNALKTMEKYLIHIAEKHGCGKIFSSVKNKTLIKVRESIGYLKADEAVTEMIYYKGV